VDSVVAGGEERSSQPKCIADAHAEIDMEVARERELQERRMWDATGYASPSLEDIREVVV
jgi:hypothetical protein